MYTFSRYLMILIFELCLLHLPIPMTERAYIHRCIHFYVLEKKKKKKAGNKETHDCMCNHTPMNELWSYNVKSQKKEKKRKKEEEKHNVLYIRLKRITNHILII